MGGIQPLEIKYTHFSPVFVLGLGRVGNSEEMAAEKCLIPKVSNCGGAGE